MRRCTRNYLEGILKLYPEYVAMIQYREQMLLHPNEIYIDQNTGGGRSSFVSRQTEAKAMMLMNDEELDAIKYHRSVIKSVLDNTDDITVGIVEAHYFNGIAIEIIAQELETTQDLCNKLRRRFLDSLASEFRLIK
jgi:RinA family phage transcriptional activator